MDEAEVTSLKKEIERLTHELEDLRILGENTIDHSTQLENTLIEQNTRLDLLKDKMKKYLSPQLYKALVGGTSNAEIIHKRKKLTIFFSDIVGFSAITDSVESELLSDVLNQYLNRMAEIATKWGGTIDKFMGDGMMVFFGDPEFIDDATHALNCARMALEMLDELSILRSRWRQMGMFHTLRVRMGINTGYCTVGNFGSSNRMEYTIVGDCGTVEFNSSGIAPTMFRVDGEKEELALPERDGYQAELEYFVDCCRNNKQPEFCPAEESAAAVKLGLQLVEARQRKGEKIPVKL